MSFPKKGKFFPDGEANGGGSSLKDVRFAGEIAAGKDEQQAIDDSIIKATTVADLLAQGQFEKAMLQLHSK